MIRRESHWPYQRLPGIDDENKGDQAHYHKDNSLKGVCKSSSSGTSHEDVTQDNQGNDQARAKAAPHPTRGCGRVCKECWESPGGDGFDGFTRADDPNQKIGNNQENENGKQKDIQSSRTLESGSEKLDFELDSHAFLPNAHKRMPIRKKMAAWTKPLIDAISP